MSKFNDFNSEAAKSKVSEIAKVISQLEAFTNNLQSKVDGLLKAKQTQFVNSYKVHMDLIKGQLNGLALQLKKKNELIQQYQHEGKMSYLLKRVSFLESEQKKLLTYLEKKKSEVRQLQLDNNIKNSEIKRLQQKVKQLIKSKAKAQQKDERDNNMSYESIPTFATQVGQQTSKKALSKIMTQDRSIKMHSFHQRSQKSDMSINPESIIDYSNNKLQKQISSLRKKNRELVYFNSKFISDSNNMESFFIQTVNQIRKNIIVRKKVKQCTFEQFRKQDKLQLLIKVLSNDDILFNLYSLIFRKRQNPFIQDHRKIDRPRSLKGKSKQPKQAQNYFPSLNSARFS